MISVDKIATCVAAVAAPLIAFAIDQHWVSAVQGADLGAVIAAAIGALHVNNDKAKVALRQVEEMPSAPVSEPPSVNYTVL